MTTANIFDLTELYKEYFNRNPYFVSNDANEPLTQDVETFNIERNKHPRGKIHYSRKNIAFNKIGAYGQDIWHPIELRGRKGNENLSLEIEACTIAVNSVMNIVSTPVIERKGTVNEIISIDDYKFTVRGFLIDKNRKVPENQITTLVSIMESTEEKTLHGGYPELFLDETCRIVISELEFPEVQGGNHWIRPFSMICKSDFIADLEWRST